jgi:hypothetical protein
VPATTKRSFRATVVDEEEVEENPYHHLGRGLSLSRA